MVPSGSLHNSLYLNLMPSEPAQISKTKLDQEATRKIIKQFKSLVHFFLIMSEFAEALLQVWPFESRLMQEGTAFTGSR